MSEVSPPALSLPRYLVEQAVATALEEDLGGVGDITTNAIIPPDAQGDASIIVRKPGVIAGLDLAAASFKSLDPDVRFTRIVEDGSKVEAGATIARIAGKTRAVGGIVGRAAAGADQRIRLRAHVVALTVDDEDAVRHHAHDAKAGEVAELERQHAEQLLGRHRAEGDARQHLAHRLLAVDRERGLRHLDANHHGKIARHARRGAGDQKPAAHGGAAGLRRAADQNADATGKLEAFALKVGQLLRLRSKGRARELVVGRRRQVQDRDRDLAGGVLEAGKAPADRKFAGRLQPDAQTRRINHRRRRGGKRRDADQDGEQRQPKPAHAGTAFLADAGGCLARAGTWRQPALNHRARRCPAAREFVTGCLAAQNAPPI